MHLRIQKDLENKISTYNYLLYKKKLGHGMVSFLSFNFSHLTMFCDTRHGDIYLKKAALGRLRQGDCKLKVSLGCI